MEAHRIRRKRPELVRRRLLDCAARLAVEQGLGAVTVQAVATAAGITKGGLFHHFPSKAALIEGVFRDLLERFDAEIDAGMARDHEAHGRFTRAYVAATFVEREAGEATLWAALSISMLTDAALRRMWSAWLNGRLERHRETESDPALEVARYAADGIWLAQLLQPDSNSMPGLRRLRQRLDALSRGDAGS